MEATLSISEKGDVRFINIALNGNVHKISQTIPMNDSFKFKVIDENGKGYLIELDGLKINTISVED